MIPKKVSKSNLAKTARFVKSLPSLDLRASSLKASKNAEKKFGYAQGTLRTMNAIKLKEYRGFDALKRWGISFNASLKDTNQALGMDLANFIKTNFPNGKVLEFGCGSGRTISQLQRSVPTASFSALGLRVVSDWSKHSNYKKINWHVAHAENLKFIKKSIPQGSLDFVFSSLGIAHSGDIMHTLGEVGSLIKSGGFLAVNFEASTLPDLKAIQKKGFSVVKQKVVLVNSDRPLSLKALDSEYPVYTLLLKKL